MNNNFQLHNPRKSSNIIKAMHLNIQSIKGKSAELGHYLATQKKNVCSLNETWLTKRDKLSFSNYKVFRKERESKERGGVSLLVHNELCPEELHIKTDSELIAINIPNAFGARSDLVIASYYCPPDTLINTKILEEIFSSRNVLLLGDLNGRSPLWFNKNINLNGKIIEKIIENQNLTILNPEHPTYMPLHRLDYSSVLDLAICNE